MKNPETRSDLFGTLVAALIALVTVIGAITTWRVASIFDDAGSADSAGIRALTNKEDATTRATILLIEHLTAYAAYVQNHSLADTYDAFARANPGQIDFSVYAGAFRYAENQAWNAIPQAYIDREGQLDQKRDLGEHIAQDARSIDVESQPHFARADANRQKARWLFLTIVLYSLVLILLTTADAVGNRLRYLFFAGGLILFTIAILAGALVELLSALVFK